MTRYGIALGVFVFVSTGVPAAAWHGGPPCSVFDQHCTKCKGPGDKQPWYCPPPQKPSPPPPAAAPPPPPAPAPPPPPPPPAPAPTTWWFPTHGVLWHRGGDDIVETRMAWVAPGGGAGVYGHRLVFSAAHSPKCLRADTNLPEKYDWCASFRPELETYGHTLGTFAVGRVRAGWIYHGLWRFMWADCHSRNHLTCGDKTMPAPATLKAVEQYLDGVPYGSRIPQKTVWLIRDLRTQRLLDITFRPNGGPVTGRWVVRP